MVYKNILSNFDGKNRLIKINREQNLNALNNETIAELSTELMISDDDYNTKCVIITGSGNKAFVAGADIKEFANYDFDQAFELSNNGHQKLFSLIENLSKPVIAAINGFALGGGLELALSCHLRYASSNAKMGLPETTLGLIPGYGGTQRLAQIIGKGRATEMILTAKMIDSMTAYQYGLVSEVFESDMLIEKVMVIADKLSSGSSKAYMQAIKSINNLYNNNLNGLYEESKLFAECFEFHDSKIGINAFLNKEKPIFD